jgi:hypothetical protein
MGDMALEILRRTICCGSVFYFTERRFNSSEPHYFVLINKDPISDSRLIFINATSQVDKRKKVIRLSKLPPDTLVEVIPGRCSFLKLNTAFDCNSYTEYFAEALIGRLQSKSFHYVGEMPADVLTEIIKGVLISPQIDEDTKDLLG